LDIAVGFIDHPIDPLPTAPRLSFQIHYRFSCAGKESRWCESRAAHARFQLTTQKIGCYVSQASKDKIDADKPFRGM
jgi:hypothetical protein